MASSRTWGGLAAGMAAMVALAGCTASDDALTHPIGQVDSRFAIPNVKTQPSDKIIKLPAAPEDVDCPDVEIFDGGATARIGGPASQDVRYQFDISDVARECNPQGGQFALKVGVSGRLLIGPAGSPGSYTSSLHVLVKRDIDDKVMFEKTYPLSADTAGAAQVPYRLVTEPVLLPLTRARLDLDYSVYVGLGSGGRPAAVRHKRPRPNG